MTKSDLLYVGNKYIEKSQLRCPLSPISGTDVSFVRSSGSQPASHTSWFRCRTGPLDHVLYRILLTLHKTSTNVSEIYLCSPSHVERLISRYLPLPLNIGPLMMCSAVSPLLSFHSSGMHQSSEYIVLVVQRSEFTDLIVWHNAAKIWYDFWHSELPSDDFRLSAR